MFVSYHLFLIGIAGSHESSVAAGIGTESDGTRVLTRAALLSVPLNGHQLPPI